MPTPGLRQEFERLLQTDAGDLLDCRNADAPMLEIELLEGKAGPSHMLSHLLGAGH